MAGPPRNQKLFWRISDNSCKSNSIQSLASISAGSRQRIEEIICTGFGLPGTVRFTGSRQDWFKTSTRFHQYPMVAEYLVLKPK
jgi:hypothetical protein